jgi:ABC-2 type transport system permease protein
MTSPPQSPTRVPLPRLLRRFWAASLAAELEYGVNALIELVAVLGNLAGSLFVLSLFYRHGRDLGGWSWDQALVVLGLYTLLDGLTTALLQPNLGALVNHVQRGTLDYVLLKPVDSQLWLSLRSLSPWGAPGMLLGLALVVVGVLRSGGPPTPAALLTGLMLLGAAALLLYSLWFVLAATSIWFVKVWNATEVLRATLVAGRYPISAYPAGLRLLFTLVLPVAFLTTVPAEALLGRASAPMVVAAGVVAAVALAISRLFWLFALRHYTSASS